MDQETFEALRQALLDLWQKISDAIAAVAREIARWWYATQPHRDTMARRKLRRVATLMRARQGGAYAATIHT